MNSICSPIFITIILFTQINLIKAQCHIEDWTALKAFYENTNGDNWNNRTGWDVQIANKNNPSANCNLSTLFGVEVPLSTNRVKSLNMPSNNLNGSIPGEIENLQYLEHLILSNNITLNGSIPSAIGNLTMLKDLILNGNKLIGSLPTEVGNLINLKQIYLGFNNLSGEIPSSIGNLNKLLALGLDNNQFSGNIPTEIGDLSSLQQLWLQGNFLDGEIPAEIGELNNLNKLAVAVNNLHGCFPINLKRFCTQITDPNFSGQKNIDNNNIFDARWDDFCTNDSGSCESLIIKDNAAPTNYSGNVNIETTAANILRNNYATIYNDCNSDCDELEIIEACDRVTGFNNLSANEALWAASNAAHFIAPYFATYQNTELSPVNIIVNYTCDVHESVYKPTNNTILLGKGDGAKRNSMAAPDIVAHEYAHHILHSIENLNFANYGIPGAISESFSDIFGEVIKYRHTNGQNDWVFGADVMANGASHNGLRSLKNPKDSQMKYQLPNTYKGEHWIDTEEVCFHNDLCGVHTNSGVHNYWFYLLAKGGSGVNDNGDAYNISGIGIEKAFDIVFENLSNHLPAEVAYEEVMLGSIQAAKSLFGEVSNEVSMVIDAWNAVGLDYGVQNPIKFRLKAQQAGDVIQQNGVTDIPVQFDLIIDSLGQDLSADGLCFILHLPDSYRGFKIDKVYSPLTINEVDTVSGLNEMNICIDRQDTNAQKTKRAYEKISSNEPILSAGVCIVVEDLDGEENTIEPLNISGFTKVNSNEIISFTPGNLSFGFDQEEISLNLKIVHENCNSFGSIEILASGNPPYTYHLMQAGNSSINSSPTINNISYKFYNLEIGDYEIVVFDSANRKVNEKFRIDFVADLNGSICCPNNLIIPSGIMNEQYNATATISLSNGTLITEGTLKICD